MRAANAMRPRNCLKTGDSVKIIRRITVKDTHKKKIQHRAKVTLFFGDASVFSTPKPTDRHGKQKKRGEEQKKQLGRKTNTIGSLSREKNKQRTQNWT